jgi:ferredoxin
MGITAVALMTVQQVGVAALAASAGRVEVAGPLSRQSADALVAERKRDDSQGIFGFLRGERREYTVRYDETRDDATFTLIQTQELTTAAQYDKRDYRSQDVRCHEGPIPVQCRSAACGTCWVGILEGTNKLSPVTPFERRQVREFGYLDSEDPRPIIRLACQTQAFGNVSIVIPPWNGIFGKYLQQALEAKQSGPGVAR